MRIMQKRLVMRTALTPLCVYCWCWAPFAQSVSAAEEKAEEVWKWPRAAGHTWGKYINSGRRESKHIPLSCWHKAIRELDPLYVYRHGFNIVVALKREDDMEEGVYIQNPISSFAMSEGQEVDGFELAKADGKRPSRFTRTIPTDHAPGGVPAPPHPGR
ncbi:MAG: hypothetical protein HN380_19370 [Victivallales bacterium]|jgi:hypothetical protein|nr:hypothetical protein [Victivallales bacterium]